MFPFPKCEEKNAECRQFNELMLRWELSAAMRENQTMGFGDCITSPVDCAAEKFTDAYKTAGATVSFTVDHIYRGLKLRTEHTAACFLEKKITNMQAGEVLTPQGMQKLFQFKIPAWDIQFWKQPDFINASQCAKQTFQAEGARRIAATVDAFSIAKGLNYFSGSPDEKGLVNAFILTGAFGLYPTAQSAEQRVNNALVQNIQAVPEATNLCNKPEFPRAKSADEVKQYRALFNSYSEKFVARWNKENGEVKKAPRWTEDDGNRFPDEHEVENYDTQLVCDILEAIETNRQSLLSAMLEKYKMLPMDTAENMEGFSQVEKKWVENHAKPIAKLYHRLLAWGKGVDANLLSWDLDEKSKLMFHLSLSGESMLRIHLDVKRIFKSEGGDPDFLDALDESKIDKVQYLPWFQNKKVNSYVRLLSGALPDHPLLRLPFHVVEELRPENFERPEGDSEVGVIASSDNPKKYYVFFENRAFKVTNIAAHLETQKYVMDIADAIEESANEVGIDEGFETFLKGSAEMLRKGDFDNLSAYSIVYEDLKQQSNESRLVIHWLSELLGLPSPSFTVSIREDASDYLDLEPLLAELRAEVESIATRNRIQLIHGQKTVFSLVSNIISAGSLGGYAGGPGSIAGVSHPESLQETSLRTAEVRKDELTLNASDDNSLYINIYKRLFGTEAQNYVPNFLRSINLHEKSHAFDPGFNTIVGSEQKTSLYQALIFGGENYQSAYIEALAIAAQFKMCKSLEEVQVNIALLLGKFPVSPSINVADGHSTASQALIAEFFKNESLQIKNGRIVVSDIEKLVASAQLFRSNLLEASLNRELEAKEISVAISQQLTASILDIPTELYDLNIKAKQGLSKVTGYTQALLE